MKAQADRDWLSDQSQSQLKAWPRASPSTHGQGARAAVRRGQDSLDAHRLMRIDQVARRAQVVRTCCCVRLGRLVTPRMRNDCRGRRASFARDAVSQDVR